MGQMDERRALTEDGRVFYCQRGSECEDTETSTQPFGVRLNVETGVEERRRGRGRDTVSPGKMPAPNCAGPGRSWQQVVMVREAS